MQALAERSLGGDPREFELQVGNRQAIFESGCLGGSRCFETKVRSALAAASLELQNLQLTRAFEHRETGALDSAARRYVAFEYLHYRLLRCFFRKERQADLYGVQLGDFGFAACAAIFLGAEKEARWLGREYARHVDAGYEDPGTLDPDFLNACRWIVGVHLGTGPARSLPGGLYEELPNAFARPQSAPQALDAAYNRRTEEAYRRIVLDDESETPYYRH